MDKNEVLVNIDNLVLNLFTDRFKNEKESNKTLGIDNDNILNNIIDKIQANKINYVKQNTNSLNLQMINNVSFNKEWRRLHINQKIIKFNEYIDLHFSGKLNNILKVNLVHDLEKKNKSIIYNKEKMKIIYIRFGFNKNNDPIIL